MWEEGVCIYCTPEVFNNFPTGKLGGIELLMWLCEWYIRESDAELGFKKKKK